MKWKIKVIHVTVNGPADQKNIDKYEQLVEQFITAQDGRVVMPYFTAVTPIPSSGSSWFTAIIQYTEREAANAPVA